MAKKAAAKEVKKKGNYCPQFTSASAVFEKADDKMCSHVYTTDGGCNGRVCCIGCPEIKTGCNGVCGPARGKGDAHKETLERHQIAETAAVEVVEMEGRVEEAQSDDQSAIEKSIAEVYQVMGRIQGVKMVSDFGTVSNLIWLKGLKENKAYRDIPGLGTWEVTCKKTTGYSAKHIDEQLKNLDVLGAAFLETVSGFRVGHRELKRLRQLSSEGALQIEDKVFCIDGEEISLDDTEELAAAIENVVAAKDREIEDAKADAKAKQRVAGAKEEVIHNMEREIARLKKEVTISDLSPEEQDAIDLLTKIQGDFQQGISAINKAIAFDTASPAVLRSLYFLYLFISKVSMEERLILNNAFEEAEEVPWEITEEELPPASVMIDELPSTRGQGLGDRLEKKTKGTD